MKGVLSFQNHKGHTAVKFDTKNAATIAECEAIWRTEVVVKGSRAFDMATRTPISSLNFDPAIADQLVVPQMCGG